MSEPLGLQQTGVQICFCDLGGRPASDEDAHDRACLMLQFLAWNKQDEERPASWAPFRNRLGQA